MMTTIDTYLLLMIFIGAEAGWLASTLIKGYGLGAIGNIAIGMVGSFLGWWLFSRLNIAIDGSSTLGGIVGATGGAISALVTLYFITGARLSQR